MFVPGEKEHPYPRVCAHRGYNTVLPESSLAAFGAAVGLGAPEIELDVRFSADEVVVACHDDRLERISDGIGKVGDFTLAELRKMDFGCRFGDDFKGLRLATFEEILAKFSRQTIINMHVKNDSFSAYSRERFRKIVDLLKKYDAMEHVYIMADQHVMECALEIAPEIPRCMSGSPDRWTIVERAIRWNCQKVQLVSGYFNQEMIDKAHANGIRCNVFFCDEPEEACHLLNMGADTILTNDYLRVSNAVKDWQKK